MTDRRIAELRKLLGRDSYLVSSLANELLDALEEAQKDSERLDWLTVERLNNSYGFVRSNGGNMFSVYDEVAHNAYTLREAIDAARAK